MNKKDISQKILRKIKDEKIKPKPKWRFLAGNYLLWTISITCLIISAIAVSVIFSQPIIGDWDALKFLGLGAFKFIFVNLPYFWFGMTVLFLVFSYYGITKTKTGYRYKKAALIVGSIIIITFIGFGFHIFNLGQLVDNGFRRHSRIYQHFNQKQGQRWQKPNNGLLAGIIVAISPKTIKIKDRQDNLWQIDITQAKIPFNNLTKNNKIKIIGEKTSNNQFKAQLVLPWQKGRDLSGFFLI